MSPTAVVNAKDVKQRLAELEQQAERLRARRADLLEELRHGRQDLDDQAQRLIDGKPLDLQTGDFETRFGSINRELAINERAQDRMRAELSLPELRSGHQAAKLLYEKAIEHVGPLAKELREVERILREAKVDVDAFTNADAQLEGMRQQHPNERAPYTTHSMYLLAQRWYWDFCGDDFPGNKSKLQQWCEDAVEAGLLHRSVTDGLAEQQRRREEAKSRREQEQRQAREERAAAEAATIAARQKRASRRQQLAGGEGA